MAEQKIIIIQGKNVAIVGNAQSLFEKRYGEDIDDNDFIIRFNKGFITSPECQGTRTNFLILACPLSRKEIDSYGAEFVANRSESSSYGNKVPYTLGNIERQNMKNFLGAQPSTGFMAVDIALFFDAKTINLYGFDWEETPTFYNPKDYKTLHNYKKEKEIIMEYEKIGKINIKK